MKKASLLKALALTPLGGFPKQGNDEFEADGHKLRVDTCYAADVECYETCVFRDGDNGTNVQHYTTEAEATLGHAQWVKQLKRTPNMPLTEKNEYDW